VTVTRQRRSFDWAIAFCVVGGSALVGYLVVEYARPVVRDRYFPWIVGRACGLGAYVALTALVVLGMWLRHPWRARFTRPHIEGQLRVHAALGSGCVALLGGHLVSLALDKYAGVGWIGTVVPGTATYRPVAVALGVIGCYLVVAIAITARAGGRIVGRQWLPVHRVALPAWSLAWFHGLLSGTDAPRLRLFYIATGLCVLAVLVTRVFGRAVATRLAVR
jgi:hypothetical protein